MMRVGIAADHGGFALKGYVGALLRKSNYEVVDFGAFELNPDDDYPDFVIPLALAVATGKVEGGVATCGAGLELALPPTKSRAFAPVSSTTSSQQAQ